MTALASALAAPAQAHASAWMSDHQMIATLAAGPDHGGQVEGDVYWERRANERLGAVARGYVSSQPDYASSFGQTAGQVSLAVKTPLYEGAAGAAALELAASYASEADPTCSGWGGQLRAMAGKGLGRAFVSVEAGYLAQRPDCVHGKLDLTAGWRPDDRWLAMGQMFLDRRYGEGHVAKVQISVVRLFSARNGLQIGLRSRIDKGGEANPALIVGWWRGGQ